VEHQPHGRAVAAEVRFDALPQHGQGQRRDGRKIVVGGDVATVAVETDLDDQTVAHESSSVTLPTASSRPRLLDKRISNRGLWSRPHTYVAVVARRAARSHSRGPNLAEIGRLVGRASLLHVLTPADQSPIFHAVVRSDLILAPTPHHT